MNCPGRNSERSASPSVMRPGAQTWRLTTVVCTRAKRLLKPIRVQRSSENLGTSENPGTECNGRLPA